MDRLEQRIEEMGRTIRGRDPRPWYVERRYGIPFWLLFAVLGVILLLTLARAWRRSARRKRRIRIHRERLRAICRNHDLARREEEALLRAAESADLIEEGAPLTEGYFDTFLAAPLQDELGEGRMLDLRVKLFGREAFPHDDSPRIAD
jgi:hypothetical protein